MKTDAERKDYLAMDPKVLAREQNYRAGKMLAATKMADAFLERQAKQAPYTGPQRRAADDNQPSEEQS